MAEKDSVQIKKRLSQDLPQYKFSVTRDDFAGGHSVSVKVLSGPIEVFASENDRNRENGYIEIWRDRYKDDERINDEIKPDIDKMYKIIYDIGQFPSGYHGGPYLHWKFGSYSNPYQVVGAKKPSTKDNPTTEKESKETNAEAELLMSFSQGWKLYKTTINKKDYDGKPLTLVVYNLNKTKDLKNIPYDKFLEFKGEMLTNLGMKWGKFQKFEKWTYPVDIDILKVIIDKYYGVGEDKKEQEFKVGDVYYSKLFEQKLTIAKVQDDTIFVDYEDDSSERYTPQYCILMIARGDWIKVVDEEKEEGSSEEDIKKAIAALEILAQDGDEEAKKVIKALKILLN